MEAILEQQASSIQDEVESVMDDVLDEKPIWLLCDQKMTCLESIQC